MVSDSHFVEDIYGKEDLLKMKNFVAVMLTWIYRILFKFRVPGRARFHRVVANDGFFVKIAVHPNAPSFLLKVVPSDFIDQKILQFGYYEPEVVEACIKQLRPGDIFWDVGANIGLHSFFVKNNFRDAVSVFSFEPNPHAMRRLLESKVLNQLDVTPVNLALSSSAGVQKLSIASVGNPGLSSLNPWNGVEYDQLVFCGLLDANTLISSGGFPVPNVIKIDVEGHELEVLKGFGRVLEDEKIRAIVFEDTGSELVREYLQSKNFALRSISKGNTIALRHV